MRREGRFGKEAESSSGLSDSYLRCERCECCGKFPGASELVLRTNSGMDGWYWYLDEFPGTEGRGSMPFEPERDELREDAVEDDRVLPGNDITLPGADRSLSLAEL